MQLSVLMLDAVLYQVMLKIALRQYINILIYKTLTSQASPSCMHSRLLRTFDGIVDLLVHDIPVISLGHLFFNFYESTLTNPPRPVYCLCIVHAVIYFVLFPHTSDSNTFQEYDCLYSEAIIFLNWWNYFRFHAGPLPAPVS